jgi:hypothetical protein
MSRAILRTIITALALSGCAGPVLPKGGALADTVPPGAVLIKREVNECARVGGTYVQVGAGYECVTQGL